MFGRSILAVALVYAFVGKKTESLRTPTGTQEISSGKRQNSEGRSAKLDMGVRGIEIRRPQYAVFGGPLRL
jgi:hypothetical protein